VNGSASQKGMSAGLTPKANWVKFGPTPHQQNEARKRVEAGETQRSIAAATTSSSDDFEAIVCPISTLIV